MVASTKCNSVQELEIRFRKLGVRPLSSFNVLAASRVLGPKGIRVQSQIQKRRRSYSKELERAILTDDLRLRGDEINRKRRELRKKGPGSDQSLRELWESEAPAWVGDLIEGAEKKGLTGLHFLEDWVEEWIRELGQQGGAQRTTDLIREELQKAYARKNCPH